MIPLRRGHRRHGAALSALMVTALLFPASATASPAASIGLDPTYGPPTTKVQVTGQGFGATETVLIRFDHHKVGRTTSDGSGSFIRSIKVPASAPPGDHRVKATGASSGISASATFVVRTDWRQDRFDGAQTGYNPYENVLDPTNVGSLTVRWSHAAWCCASNTIVANGDVYFASTGGKVLALDAATGEYDWSYTTGRFFAAGLAADDGLLYVESQDSKLYAIRADTGALAWAARVRGFLQGPPTVSGGKVFVAPAGDRIEAFDAASGERIWSQKVTDEIHTRPAVSNGLVYIGSSDGTAFALRAETGALQWSFQTGDGIDGGPTVAHGVTYVGSKDGKLYALDAGTGAKKWSSRIGRILGSAAVAEDIVYMSTWGKRLYAIDGETGDVIWSRKATYPIGSPAIADGVVYGSSYPDGYAFDASTGSVLCTLPFGGGGIVANGIVYLGNDADTVYAFGVP